MASFERDRSTDVRARRDARRPAGQWRRTRRFVRGVLGGRFEGVWDRRVAHTADVVVVSYPKSGTTWLRYMLGCYLQSVWDLPSTPVFDAADRRLRAAAVGPLGLRLYVTHGGLQWIDQRAGDLTERVLIEPYTRGRTVLVVRHPLDVIVSMHHYYSREQYGGDVAAMALDPVWGVEKFIAFTDLWAKRLDDPTVLLCRYEDLRRAPESKLEDIARFLDVPVVPEAVHSAVQRSSFDEMRRLEAAGDDPVATSTGLRILSGGRTLGRGPKVRKGATGAWRAELGDELSDQLERLVRERVDPRYGYGDQSEPRPRTK